MGVYSTEIAGDDINKIDLSTEGAKKAQKFSDNVMKFLEEHDLIKEGNDTTPPLKRIEQFKDYFKLGLKKHYPEFDVEQFFQYRLKDNGIMIAAITAFEKVTLINSYLPNDLKNGK